MDLVYNTAQHISLVIHKTKNTLHNATAKKQNNTFLFILCPPYSGSTLLTKILASSPQVSVNNPFGTCEGFQLPEVKSMYDVKYARKPDANLDYTRLKPIWLRYWNTSRPYLLDKDPQNIYHTQEISKVFSPITFIILTRHPLALAQSIMQRHNVDAQHAANFVIEQYKYLNKATISKHIHLSYEDMCQGRMSLPFALKSKRKFLVHNNFGPNYGYPKNTNKEKIASLTTENRQLLIKKFRKHNKLFTSFNYVL